MRKSQDKQTTAENLEEKFDRGEEVLDYFDVRDHDIPFSKGGSSLTVANVRLLCAKHNLEKSEDFGDCAVDFYRRCIITAHSKTVGLSSGLATNPSLR